MSELREKLPDYVQESEWEDQSISLTTFTVTVLREDAPAIRRLLASHEEREGEDVDGLLPCPFCGGEPEVIRAGDRRQSCIVGCTTCGCRLESNEPGAGWAWNRRLRSHTDREPDGWLVEWRFALGASQHRPWTRGGWLHADIQGAEREAEPRTNYETRIRPVYIGTSVQSEEEEQ